MDYAKEALRLHAKWNGKLETVPKMKIENRDDLSIAYTPGVAAPCLEIEKDKKNSYVYTGRAHTVAVISDGSAVLGLGNIGPEAGMPVMEGKCVLFKALGNVDAVPLCLNTQDTDELVQIISSLEPSFGGINLEDIAAPRCFEVEKRLQEKKAALDKEKKMQQAMLQIKKKFGKNAILKGMNLLDGATAKERNEQIGGHKA